MAFPSVDAGARGRCSLLSDHCARDQSDADTKSAAQGDWAALSRKPEFKSQLEVYRSPDTDRCGLGRRYDDRVLPFACS